LASQRRLPELVVIGVSTGGPTLLIKLLKDIATPTVPMLIAQHMPAGETAGFALRLSEVSGHQVVEVGRGSLPPVGTFGVVQGGMDFQISPAPNGQMRLREASVPGNPFHPSIDHLLRTAAEAGIPTHTVILTGMGQDGSVGALALSQQGYPVVAQRPETCAVAGMPSAAIQNGSARLVQSPEQIVETINRWFASVQSGALSSAS
jgi:two-component system chemotaxis response regulator CheB